MLQHTASAQAVVRTAEAASQSCTQAEQSSAAEQQIEALHGEVMGLQLKVQSLQGIINIQEQQLKAAAGQSSDDQDQVGLYLLFTSNTVMLTGMIMWATLCIPGSLPYAA